MPNPVTLAGQNFRSYAEADRELLHPLHKRYKNRATWGKRIGPDDAKILWELYKHALRHGDTEYFLAKIQNGTFSHWTVDRDDFNSYCFYLVDSDGNRSKFSIFGAIRSKAASPEKIRKAFQKAVEQDLEAFRDKYFAEHARADGSVKCFFTGRRITRDESIILYLGDKGFSEILNGFIRERNHIVNLIGVDEFGHIRTLKLREDFRQYHHERAELIVVSIASEWQQKAFQAELAALLQ